MNTSIQPQRFALAALLCGLTCLSATTSVAQAQVSLRIRTDAPQVRTGEPFRVEVRAESTDGRVDNINVENLSDFQVVGRQQALSTSFSFGFGSQSKSSQTTIQTLTLIAKQSGEHTIGPAVAMLRGKRFESNTIVINASGEGIGSPSSQVDDLKLQAEGHAFLRVRSDKDTAFVGEQITVDATLYTRDLLAQPLSILKELQIKGAWTHNLLDDPTQVEAEQVSVEGQPYFAYQFKHVAAFALSDAPVTIDAMQVEGVSGQRFGLRRRLTPINATSEAATVDIKPLPAGVSSDAAVGRFELSAELDRRSVVTGDAVTLSATVQGTGSLATVSPKLALGNGLRALDPTVTKTVEVNAGLVGGSKTFKWIVVAESAGKHQLELTLATFDPQSRKAKTLRVDDLSFESAGLANPTASGQDKLTETQVDDAIALPPARGPGDGNLRERALLSRPMSILLLLASIALFVGALLFRVIAGKSKQKANDPWQSARAHLERAKTSCSQPDSGEQPDAVPELERALRVSLDATLGRPTASMTLADLRSAMLSAGIEPRLVEDTTNLQQDLEFARFSPTSSDTQALLRRTNDACQKLQRHAQDRR